MLFCSHTLSAQLTMHLEFQCELYIPLHIIHAAFRVQKFNACVGFSYNISPAMRRSERNRIKSLKAELEENARATYHQIKHNSVERKTRFGCAFIGNAGEEDSSNLTSEDVETDEEEGEMEVAIAEKMGPGRYHSSSKTKGRTGQRKEELVEQENTDSAPVNQHQQQNGEEEGSGDGGWERSASGRWSQYDSLCTLLPGRQRQIHLLLSLLGEVSVLSLLGEVSAEGRISFFLFIAASPVDLSCTVCVWKHFDREVTHT